MQQKEPVLIVAHGGVWKEVLKILNIPSLGAKNAVPYYCRHSTQEEQPGFVCPLGEEV